MNRPEIIYMFAMSLDGFIAREDGRFDWLDEFPADADFDFDAFLGSVGGIVMGRESFEVANRHETWPYARFPTVVGTHRELHDLPENVRALAGAPRDLLDALQEMGCSGRIWLFGGGNLARRFLDAGLLDIVEAGIIPVVLGSGIPAFGGLQDDRWLKLEFAKALGHGAIHARYRVKKPEA